MTTNVEPQAHVMTEPIALPNDTVIELCTRDDEFLGLGRVTMAGTSLRSGRRPMFVDIRTPNGVQLCRYRLASRQALPDGGVLLTFTMQQQAGGMMEWMVHEVRNRYNTADWSCGPQPAAAVLTLEIHPVSRTLGSAACSGFSYQYHYTSDVLPIYKILDRGTWEIGESALGNECWMRNATVPSIYAFAQPGQFYSTEWYLPMCLNPSGFQFHPLQTQLQGFTMTAATDGVLFTWPTEVAHIRTLIEKPREAEEIVHWHEHCGDLSSACSTAPVEVLWCPGAFDRVARANLHNTMFTMVADTLHAQLGMRRERVTTYGVIEEWSLPDMAEYTKSVLPQMLDLQLKTIFLPNEFENNMNTWGVGNMCCTVDYQVAESVGTEALTAFCRTAKQGGARVEMWGNTAISTLTAILKPQEGGYHKRVDYLPQAGSIQDVLERAKAPFVRNPSNAIEADHYTPVFAVLNLRDPAIRAYWRERWQVAHDNIGLEGIFLDSSFNLSSDKFHYVQNCDAERAGATIDQADVHGHVRPAHDREQAILSQYHAHLSLMAEMQRMGYHYAGEDIGVFGVHRSGPSILHRLDNLFLWADCLAVFDAPEMTRCGADPDAVFFRGLAYRLMWMIYWDFAQHRPTFYFAGSREDVDHPTPWHLSLLRAYNAVDAHMRQRTILPEERGVCYADPSTRVLWAFDDMTLPLSAPSRIHDVCAGTTCDGDRVKALRHHIYRIEPLP